MIRIEKCKDEHIRIYHITVKTTEKLIENLEKIRGLEPIYYFHTIYNYNIQIMKGQLFDWEPLEEKIQTILKDHIRKGE